MKTYAKATMLLAAVALSGCSTVSGTWAPFPAQSELASFASRWEAAQKTPST